jgi:hypothetical protein
MIPREWKEAEMATWEQRRQQRMEKLKAAVEAEGGIKTYDMGELRDAAGWGKLGNRVVIDIANLLAAHGLGYLPATRALPTDQDRMVRVYVERSPVGKIIEAVLSPSQQGDKRLREAASSDAEQVLEAVRTLVCETT